MFDTTDTLTLVVGAVLLLTAAYTGLDHWRVVRAVRVQRILEHTVGNHCIDQDCD